MAKERDTGARGLRSIVEEVMIDIMYELPDMESKEKFVVTEDVVNGKNHLFQHKPHGDPKPHVQPQIQPQPERVVA